MTSSRLKKYPSSNLPHMKKLLLPLSALLFLQVNAATWNVQVEDFQFSPSSLNVKVGDVIHWEWVSGFHTTTSLGIPSGAATWQEGISASSKTFDYTVTTVGTYSYQCDFHLQMQASFTATSVLPVTMSLFTVKADKSTVALNWTTDFESNSDYFSIRKSLDGSTFDEIGRVAAAGNSTTQRHYTFTDYAHGERYLYYSIAMIDKDGRFQLTPIQVAKNDLAAQKILVAISPNPVNSMGHVQLKFNADRKGELTVRVFDINGKQVEQFLMGASPGVNNGHMHLANLPAGTYHIQLSIDDLKETHTLIKM